MQARWPYWKSKEREVSQTRRDGKDRQVCEACTHALLSMLIPEMVRAFLFPTLKTWRGELRTLRFVKVPSLRENGRCVRTPNLQEAKNR